MSCLVLVAPEAEGEIAQAADWYGAHEKRLAIDFLRAVDDALLSVEHTPHQYQIV